MTRIDDHRRPAPVDIIVEDYLEDVDLGVLKRGKEADVHLVERIGPDRTCLLVRKRYVGAEHRAFRNDLAYRAHRRIDGVARNRGGAKVRRKQGRALQLAMDKKTAYGRKALQAQWIGSEWRMLERLWQLGVPVPYPVARTDDGLLMQYLGDRETAAPRLADARVPRPALAGLFEQARAAILAIARAGVVHADLSAYNVLLWDRQLWVIDLPQAVPYLENLEATEFLHRDCRNLCAWFRRKGLTVDDEALFVEATTALFDYQMQDMFRAHGG